MIDRSVFDKHRRTHVQPLRCVGVHVDIVRQGEVAVAGMVMLCKEAYVRSIAHIYIAQRNLFEGTETQDTPGCAPSAHVNSITIGSCASKTLTTDQ